MERIKDVAAIVDRWEQNGEEQVKWHTIGELVKTSKGSTMVKLWSIPTGNKWDGALFFFDPRPSKQQFKEGMQEVKKSSRPSEVEPLKEDDIPF
jgi:hypothetical protein